MTAFSPNFALPYENPMPSGDEPGVTLHGGVPPTGLPADQQILALRVDQVLTQFAQDIADVADQILAAGWRPIVTGSVLSGVASISIDLTNGGAFPAGTFSQIKLVMTGDFDVAGHIGIRLNNDATSIYRRHYRSTDSSGAVITSASATGSAWLVGRWGATAGNNLVFEMFGTEVSSLIGYQAHAFQQSTANGVDTTGGGRLDSNMLPNSMTVFPTNGAATFGSAGAKFWVEGYIA